MNLKEPEIDGRLPEPVRHALIEASRVGAPESLDRRCAIDSAIAHARLHYPSFFVEESPNEVGRSE